MNTTHAITFKLYAISKTPFSSLHPCPCVPLTTQVTDHFPLPHPVTQDDFPIFLYTECPFLKLRLCLHITWVHTSNWMNRTSISKTTGRLYKVARQRHWGTNRWSVSLGHMLDMLCLKRSRVSDKFAAEASWEQLYYASDRLFLAVITRNICSVTLSFNTLNSPMQSTSCLLNS